MIPAWGGLGDLLFGWHQHNTEGNKVDIKADVTHIEQVGISVAQEIANDVLAAVKASDQYGPIVASYAQRFLSDLSAVAAAAGQ